MTETLSIRIDPETKKRLDALSKSSQQLKSLLAAAIEAYVDSQYSQLGEILAGIGGLDSGPSISHENNQRPSFTLVPALTFSRTSVFPSGHVISSLTSLSLPKPKCKGTRADDA